jgi:hypothetical protein
MMYTTNKTTIGAGAYTDSQAHAPAYTYKSIGNYIKGEYIDNEGGRKVKKYQVRR